MSELEFKKIAMKICYHSPMNSKSVLQYTFIFSKFRKRKQRITHWSGIKFKLNLYMIQLYIKFELNVCNVC